MAYCTLCDKYFPSADARVTHVQMSTNHPECSSCNVRFANKNSLRTHWACSLRHNYCSVCERHFKTAAGLKVHTETAAVHRDDSDDDDDDEDDDDDDLPTGWEDAYGRVRYPEENDRIAALTAEMRDDISFEDYWEEDEIDDFFEDDTSSGYSSSSINGDGVLVDVISADSDPFAEKGEALALYEEVETLSLKDEEYARAECAKFMCPICLKAPAKSSATRCGHVFCTSCIHQSLRKELNCPVCQRVTVPGNLIQLHPSTV
ncbi:hypothetical protein FA95DRAFT_1552661 [Auriscalpium vulgare]|uniref:Uncharacterized protein n=1 Tax=Auriscalpium vulgare TaxID=40419 RepID=A0ACB8SAI9_9AGAM|nr:hypothetical protein FA95DRAFT_1552661 [Auriscalpium vulgare]